MIDSTYIVIGCEHVEDHRVCDDNICVYPEPDQIEVETDGVVIRGKFELPEGWTTVRERGGRWLRCPKHSPDSEPS